jgi:hypothetical protein
MSVYRVEVWEKFVFEVEAENKAKATRVAFSKSLNSNKNKLRDRSQTNIGKPKWLRKSEENKDE